MYTNEDPKNNIKANTNSVIALQQKLFSRSNLSLLFINRQNTAKNELDYNRVLGLITIYFQKMVFGRKILLS